MRLETQAVHAGEPSNNSEGPVVMPIFQSATFLGTGTYMRPADTPNHRALAAKLASLEGTEAAIALSSGMAAITSALHTALQPGDHVLTQAALYGGTWEFVHNELARLGVSHTTVDAREAPSWRAALRPNTKVFYAEAISNPLVEVGDLAAASAFSREHGLISIIDATFATPVLCRPCTQLGFNVVVHSATKYLNGHSDVVAGAVASSAAFISKVTDHARVYGCTLDPHAAWLVQRGVKTLALRVRQQCASALSLARFLDGHAQVSRVYYPGLPSSRDYARTVELFGGSGGGVLAFEVKGGVAAADAMLGALEVATVAVSLGSVETLVTRPALDTHLHLGAAGRKAAGIADELVRVAVGIEAVDDLLDDFAQALMVVRRALGIITLAQ
ncbi:hypothetical protein WJX81_007089 [Elliptochloris bilobata]|uniref:Cystathionine beta-lyase n=1 Tax=Elliptochloris bilobata TaxID=381761 RepID=A0AAW1RKF4_9CHLO